MAEQVEVIVIATGTTAAVPPIPGLAEVDHWTNHDAVEVEDLPTSLSILGAGAIGAELAQVFSRFGVQVTMVEALDRVVPLEEPEAEGITVHAGARAEKVIEGDDGIIVTLDNGTDLTAERLLVATGRATDLSGLGVDVVTAVKRVPETARGWLHGSGNEGVIKLVVDRRRRTLVGATSVAAHGGEVLSMPALAVHAQITVDDLRQMVYAYPTFHKGVEDALGELDL